MRNFIKILKKVMPKEIFKEFYKNYEGVGKNYAGMKNN